MLLLLLFIFVVVIVIVIVSGSGHPGHLCPAGPGLCTESTKFGRKTKQKTNGFKNISTKPANSVFVVFKLGLTYSDLNHFTISNLVLESLVENFHSLNVLLNCGLSALVLLLPTQCPQFLKQMKGICYAILYSLIIIREALILTLY